MDAEHPTERLNQPATLRQALYAALLLAIVAYSLLVLLWPAPAAYCVAVARVELRAASPEARLPALSHHEWALVCGVEPQKGTAIAVTTVSNRVSLRIRSWSLSPREALATVECAGRRFLERAPAYVVSRSTAGRDDRACEHEEQRWATLQGHVDRLLECAGRLMDAQLTQHSPPTIGTMQVSTGATPASNPAWVNANDELEAERRHLEDLLRTRTYEHPEVIKSQNRLEHLARRLDHIPPFVAPEDDAGQEMARSDLQASLNAQHFTAALRAELDELDAARQELQQALEEYAVARSAAQAHAGDQPLPFWFAEVARPATLVHRVQGNGPARRPELLWLAFSASLAITWLMRPRSSSTLRSCLELTEEWGADVVAVVGDVPESQLHQSPDWTPRLLHVAQWWVLLLLAIFLVFAVGDATFVTNFWHDPAMAIREAWSNWMIR